MKFLNRLFKQDDKEAGADERDPLHLKLSDLRPGDYVDYDLKTWKVEAVHRYDFGDGDVVNEWELVSGRERRYLEREEEDGESWSLSRKIPLAALDGAVREHILQHDDPPEKVTYKGTTYYLDSSAGGHFFPNVYAQTAEPQRELIHWDLIDEDDENFLAIEQWGEDEFEAAAGTYVEEYQFTNILPGGGDEA